MEKLKNYVEKAFHEGLSPDAIKANLLSVGWTEEDVKLAIAEGLTSSGVPAPEHGTHLGKGTLSSTVEVIINFFSFILLGIVATALGTLYYQIINSAFPDPLIVRSGFTDYSSSAIHYAIAALIIGFPLYVYSVMLWFKRFRDDEEKIESKLTKWLTYLVLLVAAVTIVGDLITSVYYLLQGEATLRFLLKALTILAIAGIIFGFYFLERKKIQYHNDITRKTFRSFGGIVAVFVVVGIIFGFSIGGSPATERQRGFDQQRVSDLSNISNCVTSFAAERKRIPESLTEVAEAGTYQYCIGNMTDPETGIPYSYRVVEPARQNGAVTEGSFELCATFSLEANAATVPQTSYVGTSERFAKHGIGTQCEIFSAVANRDISDKPYMAPVPKQ